MRTPGYKDIDLLGPLGMPFVPIIWGMTVGSRIDTSLGPTHGHVSEAQIYTHCAEIHTNPHNYPVLVVQRLDIEVLVASPAVCG